MQQNSSNEKMRKSEAQKRFEEDENAGRFAGDDADARNARAQAERAMQQQTGSRQDGNRHDMPNGGIIDGDDVRPEQGNMLEAEAQNINKRGQGDALQNNDNNLDQARNKATQGIREGRDTGTSDDRSRNSGSR